MLPLAREGSPVNHVSHDSPPFLFIHGQRDTLVPLYHSENMHRLLKEAGVESTLIIDPYKKHWFALNRSQREKVAEFFRRHFGLQR